MTLRGRNFTPSGSQFSVGDGAASLRIAVAQPVCVARDVAANALVHAEIVRRAGAHVVVFPEMSLTGYELRAEAVAATDDRLVPLQSACRSTGSIALVGAPVAGERGEHIAMLALGDEAPAVAYHKMCLGHDEAKRFVPGEQPIAIDVGSWRLGLAICKDTGSADHAAATAALGIDIYVAGVVEAAADSAVTAERARRVAAAHGVWVATAAFAGATGSGYDRTSGGSGIWRPDGSTAAELGPDPGHFIDAAIPGTVDVPARKQVEAPRR